MMKTGAIAMVVLLLVACGFSEPTSGRSVIRIGEDGLRTFSVVRQKDGVSVACPAFGLVDPVTGTLAGQAGALEPVWIVADDGRLLSVVWPERFSVRFEPEAVLYDERGKAVAQAGGRTELSQVRWDGHAGTFEDPYIASGLLFDGCYPFLP
jgi:hypothetical protein